MGVINRLWRRPLSRLREAITHQGGAMAVQFAILLLPLTVLAFGLIDVSRASIAKQQLQDSLDAAGLLAAHSPGTTDSALQAVGQPALVSNLASMGDATLVSSSFHINGNYIDATA